MQYLMLVCREEAAPLTPEDQATLANGGMAWVNEMKASGVRQDGHALQPVSTATTIRVRAGEVLVADGPFAETKEQIAGFDILECGNLDDAIEAAAKHPMARYGVLELRPFWQPDE